MAFGEEGVIFEIEWKKHERERLSSLHCTLVDCAGFFNLWNYVGFGFS